jgi:hypothetical protein
MCLVCDCFVSDIVVSSMFCLQQSLILCCFSDHFRIVDVETSRHGTDVHDDGGEGQRDRGEEEACVRWGVDG